MARDTRASNAEFYLDTASFDEAAKLCKDLSNKMTSVKNDMDGKKSNLLFSWAGAGRDMFEKKYRVLSQQFGDLSDDLRDISESIYEMEQEYIQADTDLAKALDGVENRY
jgi:WXG100 family type VII secretion target